MSLKKVGKERAYMCSYKMRVGKGKKSASNAMS